MWRALLPATLLIALAVTKPAADDAGGDPSPTPTPDGRSVDFYDALNNPTPLRLDELPESFLPEPCRTQVPAAHPDAKAAEKRRRPRKHRRLGAYLAGLDEYPKIAVVPGAVIPTDPLSRALQCLKCEAAQYDFRYVLAHGTEYVGLTHVPTGSQSLAYESFDLFVEQGLPWWSGGGLATAISGEIYGTAGLGAASRRANPQSLLGSVTQPASSMWGFYGVALAELALQQTFADWGVAALVGVLDQPNYVDTNPYANFSLGQFQNSALVNSQVLPITAGNLGVNLQWQPCRDVYTVLDIGPNNTPPQSSPFDHLRGGDLSYVLEVGVLRDRPWGLGPGAYRLQPFVATVEGVTQAGVGVNLNQQLSQRGPFGVFARLGVGGATATNVNGARAQIAAGVVVQQPLAHLTLWRRETAVNFFGIGVVWSRPSARFEPLVHPNEYALELMYSLQVTSTVALTPDLQVLWRPAGSLVEDSVILQVPLVATW